MSKASSWAPLSLISLRFLWTYRTASTVFRLFRRILTEGSDTDRVLSWGNIGRQMRGDKQCYNRINTYGRVWRKRAGKRGREGESVPESEAAGSKGAGKRGRGSVPQA